MTVKGPQPKPKRKEPAWSAEPTLRVHRSAATALRQLEAKLTTRQRQQVKQVTRRLDRAFLEEKAELVRDTIVEIQRNKQTTPNVLLQRNVWSSLDTIGMHLDQTGFTSLFKNVAPTLFRDVRLDDPRFVGLEYDLMLSFLGINENQAAAYDMPRSEFDWIFGFAEAEKKGACGFKYLSSRDFTFKEFFARACWSRVSRPDARSSISCSWSSTGASISLPFRIKNVSVAAWPTRLFPSTKGWLFTNEKQRAAALSVSEA